jgi:hypothetical protein
MLIISLAIDMRSVAIPNERFAAGLPDSARVIRVVARISLVLVRDFIGG